MIEDAGTFCHAGVAVGDAVTTAYRAIFLGAYAILPGSFYTKGTLSEAGRTGHHQNYSQHGKYR
jgi:hypothetical protein